MPATNVTDRKRYKMFVCKKDIRGTWTSWSVTDFSYHVVWSRKTQERLSFCPTGPYWSCTYLHLAPNLMVKVQLGLRSSRPDFGIPLLAMSSDVRGHRRQSQSGWFLCNRLRGYFLLNETHGWGLHTWIENDGILSKLNLWATAFNFAMSPPSFYRRSIVVRPLTLCNFTVNKMTSSKVELNNLVRRVTERQNSLPWSRNSAIFSSHALP
jgi:hypothetical protein